MAWTLCSRSSREGFSFLLPEQKKRNKDELLRTMSEKNSPAALFCLLWHFSALNKKNSLRSNSFLFLTLRKTPPLHGKKVRPDLYDLAQHCFARCLWVFASVSFVAVFFLCSFSPCYPERVKRSKGSRVHSVVYFECTRDTLMVVRITKGIKARIPTYHEYIHSNERSDVLASKEASSGLRGEAWRKIEYFPWRTKSCLSVASSFRLGK